MLEQNNVWTTVIYRLIDNGLDFWCLLLTMQALIPTHQNHKPLLMNSFLIS